MVKCPSENAAIVDQSAFWNSDGVNWDTHRIGWAIAGSCAAATVLISFVSILQHCRNYTNPTQQRQILRILYMPAVYAIISFFSFRYFRDYTYYSLIETAYEAVTLSAFLLLLIDYVASTGSGHSAEKAMSRKDKRKLPVPFCCWRYRPTKAYFMYTLKWSVLQYVIIRPACSVAGIICQHYEVLCDTQGFNPKFASVYITCITFVSITIALYGLLMFYGLTKEELVARRPLAKFLAIKLIVMFTFYQSFMLSAVKTKIKPTQYWSATNIANGINALAVCIEMVFFSALMLWAYNWSEYARAPGAPATSIWRPIWDSINYADFAVEIISSFRFFVDYARGKPTAHGHGHLAAAGPQGKMNFGQAFGVSGTARRQPVYKATAENTDPEYVVVPRSGPRPSYDEHVRLEPYTYPPDREEAGLGVGAAAISGTGQAR